MLQVPGQFLTIILFLSLMGVYLVSFNPAELSIMLVIGVVAVIFRVLDYPLAPMLLGFILGGMLEDNLRRALLIWDGNYDFLSPPHSHHNVGDLGNIAGTSLGLYSSVQNSDRINRMYHLCSWHPEQGDRNSLIPWTKQSEAVASLLTLC